MHPQLVQILLMAAVFALFYGVWKITKLPVFPLCMTVLAEDANTSELMTGKVFSYPVLAGAKIYQGSLVVLDAAGWAKPGTEAAGLVAVGRAEVQVDNTAGANGGLNVKVKRGVFRWANSAAADLIAAAQIGDACFVVDDNTVAKTVGGGRSVAGEIVDVDAVGVWVDTPSAKISTGGDVLAANNLSDLADKPTSRANLGFDVHTGIITARHKGIAGAAAYLVTTTDGDSLISTATDTAVISLPDIAAGNKGLCVTVMNIGANGAALISISPDASDKIIGTVVGVSLSGVANKDAQNTKATAKKGDYVTIMSDGTDSWLVVGGVGVWASEA